MRNGRSLLGTVAGRLRGARARAAADAADAEDTAGTTRTAERGAACVELLLCLM
jgi:hypothetical protein